MPDYKYTKDGKKVLVVGKLNSEETIVQEIFVSEKGDQEIPSGENFVVKGLLDAPLESWKAKNLRMLEVNYEKTKTTIEELTRKLDLEYSLVRGKARERIKALTLFSQNAEDDQLSLLGDFLAGDIKYLAILDPRNPGIEAFDDDNSFMVDDRGYSARRVEALKLVSLYGQSNGDLAYRRSRWSDGSGPSESKIKPCRTREEAVEALQELLDKKTEAFMSDEYSRATMDFTPWEKIEGLRICDKAKKKTQLALIEMEEQKVRNHETAIKEAQIRISQLTK